MNRDKSQTIVGRRLNEIFALSAMFGSEFNVSHCSIRERFIARIAFIGCVLRGSAQFVEIHSRWSAFLVPPLLAHGKRELSGRSPIEMIDVIEMITTSEDGDKYLPEKVVGRSEVNRSPEFNGRRSEVDTKHTYIDTHTHIYRKYRE